MSSSGKEVATPSTPQSERPLDEQQGGKSSKIGLRQRVKHFTFAWFLCTMSTGGLALAIGETPHQFKGQYYIALAVYLFNLFLFLTFTLLTLLRFIAHKQHFLAAFTSPAESFFIGAFTLSTCVIIGGIQIFAVTHGPATPGLVSLVHVLYWIYACVSLLAAILQYWIVLRAASPARPVGFSPAVFLAGYSCMLTGTLASMMVAYQPRGRQLAIVVSGVAYQGCGWCVSYVAIALYVKSLLDGGLPVYKARPAMFIPVGSGAYTAVALVGLARGIAESETWMAFSSVENYFSRHPDSPEVLRIMALFASIFLYAFAFWLFGIALLANISIVGKMPFGLSWWAFIFPNVGFVLATSALGRELESEAILWLASVMTALLVVVWIVAATGCVRAVWKGEIVWPGKDEDKDR